MMPRVMFSPKKCVALQRCDRESATFYSGVRLASANCTPESKMEQFLYKSLFYFFSKCLLIL